MPRHDALDYLEWVAAELERGHQPAVDSGEFSEHVNRLGRYVTALERDRDPNGCTDMSTPGLPSTQDVVGAWAAVMEDVQAVRKTGRNESQGFSFRGIDEVVNAVGPALRKHGVIIVPTVEDAHYRDVTVGRNSSPMRECTVRVAFTVYGPNGGHFVGTVYGEALDSGDKGTAKAQSVAYRTFLLQALTIPTDEPDPDSHVVERSAAPSEPPRPLLAPADQERFATAWVEVGIEPPAVILEATGGRTNDIAELYADEVAAAKHAARRMIDELKLPFDGSTDATADS